jgi:hypothetical protein
MGNGVWVPVDNGEIVIMPTEVVERGYSPIIYVALAGLALGLVGYLAVSYVLGRRT